ncbi:MAG: tetratricopeptide repeat protein [Candidatus Latescibacteria bacterium]|jgi:tetratricopeptide (TPR) repeat protein|nr:tetratricopeptide repeat protein [Candidatus Latescibacterota bacterium]
MTRIATTLLAITLLAAPQVFAELAALPDETTAGIADLNRQAFQAFRRHDFAGADTAALKATRLASEGGEGVDTGIAAANLGAVRTMQGRLDDAVALQGRADSIFVQLGETRLRGRLAVARAVTAFLAEQRYSAAEPDDAIAVLDQAAKWLEPEDPDLACVRAEILCCSNQGPRVQEGYAAYTSLHRGCLASGDSAKAALIATRLGRTEGLTGGHLSALKFFAEAMKLQRARDDSSDMALALRNIGLAHRKVMRYEESEAALKEALSLAEMQQDRRRVVVVSNDLSLLYAEIGDNEKAREWDLKANEAMRAIVSDLDQGRLVDSVLFDFFQLVKMRYANIQPYTADLFEGFYDQLVLERPDPLP